MNVCIPYGNFIVAALKIRRLCRYGRAAGNKRPNVVDNSIKFVIYYLLLFFISIDTEERNV